MLTYLLYGFFILACVTLILAVLLQPGKADAGALFTSSVSSTAFGPRGTQTLLAKITIGAAISFMLIALTLSLGVSGSRSVLESVSEETPTPAAASPATSPGGDASPATSPQTQGAAPAADSSPATSATATSSPQGAASPSQNP